VVRYYLIDKQSQRVTWWSTRRSREEGLNDLNDGISYWHDYIWLVPTRVMEVREDA